MTPRERQVLDTIRGAEIAGLAVGLLIVLLYAVPDALGLRATVRTGVPWPLLIGAGLCLPALVGALTAGRIWLKALDVLGRALGRKRP